MFSVIFGGNSFEHEISIVSTIALKKIVDFEYFVFVDGSKDMYLIEEKNMRSDYFASFAYKKATKLIMCKGGFMEAKSGIFSKNKFLKVPILLNLIHGQDGEDGSLAGSLALNNIPFIGPRVEACALSFNKALTKIYAKSVGVEVMPYMVVTKAEFDKNSEVSLQNLQWPVIIKPARLGSSIGISIAKDSSELKYGLEVAFEYDDLVILENFISGVKEYNLAGTKTSAIQECSFSIIEEPKKSELLKFDDKYLDFSRTARVNNAVLDENIEAQLKDSFARLYNSVFFGAIIRCDFFVIDSVVYLNEINPIPGSMANYLFEDFKSLLYKVAKFVTTMPKVKINVDYKYIKEIQCAKGKL